MFSPRLTATLAAQPLAFERIARYAASPHAWLKWLFPTSFTKSTIAIAEQSHVAHQIAARSVAHEHDRFN
jgi:hypothetical protein